MKEGNYKIYIYRWVMLAVFMFVVVVNQLLWITFAPITRDAVAFYGVTDLGIGLLSMIFMIVYIVVSIPASWVIDTYGLRMAVGIGAALTGLFGLMRGLVASSYPLVLVAQVGIAIGQPETMILGASLAATPSLMRTRSSSSSQSSFTLAVNRLTSSLKLIWSMSKPSKPLIGDGDFARRSDRRLSALRLLFINSIDDFSFSAVILLPVTFSSSALNASSSLNQNSLPFGVSGLWGTSRT